MKNIKMLCVFVGIVAPIIFAILYLALSGKVSMSIEGFAIDSSDRLYIGKDGKIEVYNGDDLIKTIPLMTSKGYSFTIKNDQLIVAAISKKFVMDLDGNIVEEYDDKSTFAYNELYRKRNKFQTINGTNYKVSNLWGYYSIKKIEDKSSTIIYKMPLLDYIVNLMDTVIFISFFIFVPIIVYKWRKNIN